MSITDQTTNQGGIFLSLRIRQTKAPSRQYNTARGRVDRRSRTSTCLVCGPLPTLTQRFRLPSPVLMNGQGRLNHGISSPQNHGRRDNRHHVQMALHLHNTALEGPYGHSAVRPQKRVELWWSDNIPDFQRIFPAPSSTRIISTESVKRWISRAKDVGSKVPFEPLRE